jgi:hypothetical protein
MDDPADGIGPIFLFFILMLGLVLFTIHEVSWIISSVATRGLLVLISCIFLTNYMKIQSHREEIFHENEALKESNCSKVILSCLQKRSNWQRHIFTFFRSALAAT